jgi:hypothetical protein
MATPILNMIFRRLFPVRSEFGPWRIAENGVKRSRIWQKGEAMIRVSDLEEVGAPTPVHTAIRARILLIEDEAKTARAELNCLKAEGFAPALAETGEDGFFLLSSEHFDAVVLDWMLPGGGNGSYCPSTEVIKRNTKPLASKLSVLGQLCNLIPAHLALNLHARPAWIPRRDPSAHGVVRSPQVLSGAMESKGLHSSAWRVGEPGDAF